MALKARIALVHISGDILMLICRFSRRMAAQAIKNRKIVRVGMAVGARSPNIIVLTAVNGEVFPIVVKICGGPSRVRCMALYAICGEVCGLVIWIIRIVIVDAVAFKAIGWGVAKVSVTVALVAILYIMAKGKGEKAMVKLGGRPSGICGVALCTIGGEVCRLVIWVRGLGIIFIVAGKTIGRRIAEISINMALVAILNIVTQRQREKIMVHYGGHPSGIGRVARGTVCGKTGALMIWVARLGIIFTMAGKTIGRGIVKIAILVTVVTILNIVAQG
ncbi:MAG: hypothetical protein CMC08_05925 [Flavobacteriaceae bacterium]|nr:hypothetical protein [Flavobacteriaceae bacterium]